MFISVHSMGRVFIWTRSDLQVDIALTQQMRNGFLGISPPFYPLKRFISPSFAVAYLPPQSFQRHFLHPVDYTLVILILLEAPATLHPRHPLQRYCNISQALMLLYRISGQCIMFSILSHN